MSVRSLVLSVAIVLTQTLGGGPSLERVQMRVVDTTLDLSPAVGAASTTFTATLTYTPASHACPPATTHVSFTWDGHRLGSSDMHGSVSPCRAALSTKPLAGYTATGSHQACGAFTYQGSHRACATFWLQAEGNPPASKSVAPTSTPHASTRTSPTTAPAGSGSLRPTTRRSTIPASPGSGPEAGGPTVPPAKGPGTAPLIGAALAGILVLWARWLFWRRRTRAETESKVPRDKP